MSKKILGILLSFILAMSFIGACSKGDADTAKENSAGNEKAGDETAGEETGTTPAGEDKLTEDSGTTITLAHNQGESYYESFYEMGDKFTELTGIKVEWMEIPSSDWETWVQAQFAAGTEPDIVWSIPPAKEYFDQGKIVDLTDYYSQENVFNGITWKDTFKDGALEVCLSNDGSRYICTAGPGASVSLYYNKDAMEDLGLGSEPPATYSDLFRMMEAAKEDGTYVPMSAMNTIIWNLGWIESDISDCLFADTDDIQKLDIIVPNEYLDTSEILLGLKTGVLDYEDPRYVEYFRIMKDFSRYWNEDFNAASWEYESLFNEGKALFNFNGGWYPSQVKQNGYTVNYGVSIKPYVDKEISQYGVSQPFHYKAPAGEALMYVTESCQKEEKVSAAVKWLMFFTDKNTGAKMYTDAVLQLPAVKDVELPEELIPLETAEYGDDVPKNYINAFKFTPEVLDIYWKAYSGYLDPSASQSAEDFAKDMKKELMPYLDEAISEYTTFDVLSYVDRVTK